MTRKRTGPIVDLSIDFDFFVRELPEWDFGHSEEQSPNVLNALWDIRYGMVDLHTETDIAEHADIEPYQLVSSLVGDKHMRFNKRLRVGIADSHMHAYRFFKVGQQPADYVVNIDAHHDAWPKSRPLNCGNWLSRLAEKWKTTRFEQVWPRWKRPSNDGQPDEVLQPDRWKWAHGWSDWRGIPDARIRSVFICRSSAWVPPHHDEKFVELAKMLASFAASSERVVVLDSLYARASVTAEQAAIQREHHRSVLEKFTESAERRLREEFHASDKGGSPAAVNNQQ